jgi:hypothetical protein
MSPFWTGLGLGLLFGCVFGLALAAFLGGCAKQNRGQDRPPWRTL